MFTMPMFGSGAFVVDGVLFTASEILFGVGGMQATAEASINPDGSTTLSETLIDPNWYIPTTGGIGSNYWVRASLISGDAPNGGEPINVWLSLSVTRTWEWVTTGGATIRQRDGTVKLEFALDSGGVTIVGTNTLFGNALVNNS